MWSLSLLAMTLLLNNYAHMSRRGVPEMMSYGILEILQALAIVKLSLLTLNFQILQHYAFVNHVHVSYENLSQTLYCSLSDFSGDFCL